MALHDQFMARHAEIESRASGHLFDFSTVDPIRALALDLAPGTKAYFARALELGDRQFTSWMAGMPLTALLAAGRRVLVDIAPPFLAAWRRNYGIPEDALIAFAKAGMLLFNIRDFDPLAPDAVRLQKAADYQRWERFLDRLFNEAPKSVYFLAALRPRLFDAIPTYGTKARHVPLVDCFGVAGSDLRDAADAATRLPQGDLQVMRATFRGEEPRPVQTFWHWAYLQKVHRLIDPEFARYLDREYHELAVASPTSENAIHEIGNRFVLFQMRLRYAHLRWSAPLSGSFGGPYGYSLDDEHVFMQAVDRHYRWQDETPFEYDYFSDDLLDLIKDLQIGRLRPRFSELLGGRAWERLSSLGVTTYCRTEPQSHYEHFSDATNCQELIAYWQGRPERGVSYDELDLQANALLGRDGGIEPRDLYDLAAKQEDVRQAARADLVRATEGFLTMADARSGFAMPGSVRATDPRQVNLIMRALIWLGLATGQERAAVGNHGDYGRTAWSAGDGFRAWPS